MGSSFALGALAGAVIVFLITSVGAQDKTEVRVGLLEPKVDRILGHLGISFKDDLPEDVRGLVAEGRKIEAIKVYREKTGVGLKEAKDAVEGRSGSAGRALRLDRKIDLILGHLGVSTRDELSERVRSLVAGGQKIEAIKFYREATGAGLKEAKDNVEAIAAASEPV